MGVGVVERGVGGLGGLGVGGVVGGKGKGGGRGGGGGGDLMGYFVGEFVCSDKVGGTPMVPSKRTPVFVNCFVFRDCFVVAKREEVVEERWGGEEEEGGGGKGKGKKEVLFFAMDVVMWEGGAQVGDTSEKVFVVAGVGGEEQRHELSFKTERARTEAYKMVCEGLKYGRGEEEEERRRRRRGGRRVLLRRRIVLHLRLQRGRREKMKGRERGRKKKRKK